MQCYALTLAHTGTGSDPVASPANSTGCSAGQYVAGAVIGLTATPSSGWSVGSWSGTDNNSSTATTNQVTMPASARTASVTYVQIPPTCYALTLAHTGTGSDPVASPANSTGCSAGQYVVGQVIGLTATPGSGWSVGSWTNTSNDSSTATTNQWTMTAAARTVTVNYVQQSGSVVSSVTPSSATPSVGGTMVATIYVDMTGAPSGTKLGSFDGKLTWNTAVLSYSSSALQGVFAGGVVNEANIAAGNIAFSSAASAGATGNITILTVTFNVVGAGTSPLTLGYTSMAAATTFTDLLPILTIHNSSVTASGTATCYALTLAHTGTGSNPVASPANSTGCSAGQYVVGQVIGLTATPGSGWSVGSWTNTSNDSSTATTNQWTMTAAARTVTVNYVQIAPTCYALTLAHTGTGSNPVASPANSTGCSAGQYVVGQVIGLTATPGSGWTVGSWTNTEQRQQHGHHQPVDHDCCRAHRHRQLRPTKRQRGIIGDPFQCHAERRRDDGGNHLRRYDRCSFWHQTWEFRRQVDLEHCRAQLQQFSAARCLRRWGGE